MPKKKPSQPEESAENQELVRRVDAMMSTELPEPETVSAKPVKPVKAGKVIKPEMPAGPPIVIQLANKDKTLGEPATESETEPVSKPVPEVNDAVITAEPPQPQDQPQRQDPLEDSATDKAIDDIVAHEGDTVLAVNDALTARQQATAQPGRPSGRPSHHKWFWLIVLIILLGTAADVAIFLTHR